MLEAQLSEAAKASLNAQEAWAGVPTPGIACFVDLAGFTTISEALGRQGTGGTERLVELINQFFDPAIATATSLGGDIVGFAGDALTVLFPPDALVPAGLWASAVLETARRLPTVEVDGELFQFGAKVGIGDGEQQTYLVGTTDARRAVTCGTAIDRAVAAEATLSPGEIGLLLSGDQLPAGTIGGREPGSVRLLTDLAGLHDAAPELSTSGQPLADPQAVDDAQIEAFVPPRVIERLQAGGQDLLNEHRPCTILFANIGQGTLHEDPSIVDHLATAMAIVDGSRGTTITLGSGDKGTTILAAFGAPVAFADQRSLAVFAAAELTRRLPCRVGVASGLCFAGMVGSTQRWNYNLMGDVVNQSARLMALASPGQVLANEPTHQASDPRLVWGPAELVSLKGRGDSVRAAALEAIAPDLPTDTDLPMTGRSDELRTIETTLLSVTVESRGRSVAITGDSGLGKTRLLQEVTDVGDRLGFRVAHLGLKNRSGERSYGPWIPVILACLGLADGAGPAELEAAGREQLSQDGPMPSLLREIVFGTAPSSDVLTGLAPKAAAEIIDTAIAELVLSDHDTPLLLLVDDAHDLDEASVRLLELLNRTVANAAVALLVVSYPDRPVADLPWSTKIELTELNAEDALALLTDHAAKAGLDLGEDERVAIANQVGGNPQLLRLLADYVGSGHSDLPTDARTLILSRFDRLNASTQTALSMAATLGRHFDRSDFVGSFAGRAGREVLLDLTMQRLIESAGPDTLSFVSPALRQVAYEATAHASRVAFHRDVGLHIERAPASDESLRVEDLAHHFGFTDDIARHRRYFAPAARRAQRAFANNQAISWFERAIAVADPTDLGPLRFDLGSTIEHVGRGDDAAHQFLLAAQDEAIKPKALASLAFLRLVSDGYEPALETITEALGAASTLDRPEVSDLVLDRASLLHLHAGEFERAKQSAEQQLAFATGLDDQHRIATALANSGGAKSWLGDLEGAGRELTEALRISIEVGALALASEVQGDLAMVELDLGHTDRCLAHLTEARSTSRSIGHRRNEAAVLGNIALALITDNRHPEAWEPTLASIKLLLQIGDAIAVAAKLGIVAMLLVADGQSRSAIGFLARVIMTGRRGATAAYRARAYDVLIEIYEELHDADRADRCRSQQARPEGDVSDDELLIVAPMTPPGQTGSDETLVELLAGADLLIERLESHDDTT